MDLKSIGERIKTARKKRNLTQEELAALVDLSPTHISVIERGVKSPKLDTFIRIANVLNVSSDYLLFNNINNSADGIIFELSKSINNLPQERKEKLIDVIKILIED